MWHPVTLVIFTLDQKSIDGKLTNWKVVNMQKKICPCAQISTDVSDVCGLPPNAYMVHPSSHSCKQENAGHSIGTSRTHTLTHTHTHTHTHRRTWSTVYLQWFSPIILWWFALVACLGKFQDKLICQSKRMWWILQHEKWNFEPANLVSASGCCVLSPLPLSPSCMRGMRLLDFHLHDSPVQHSSGAGPAGNPAFSEVMVSLFLGDLHRVPVKHQANTGMAFQKMCTSLSPWKWCSIVFIFGL